MRRVIAAGVALGLATIVLGAAPASAAEPLRLAVTLDGKDITGNTVTIEPDRPGELTITATNNSDEQVSIRSVRMTGVALALTFFSYDTTVPFDVPPRSVETRSFPLDPADLGSQATGLLPVTIEVVDVQRETIASVGTTGDVKGSLWSVYGAFGLGVLVLTALSWAGALIALARRRLPANRWQRAMRFLPAGIGTGLVAVISLSVLRLVAPSPAAEIPFIVGAAAAALLLGYVTPHPGEQPAWSDVDTVRIPR